MDLKFVKQIKEAETAAAAEQYIKDGWTLLAIIPTTRLNGTSLPCYILGKGAPSFLTANQSQT